MRAQRSEARLLPFRALTAWITGGDMHNHTRHRNVRGARRVLPSSERATG